MRWQHHEVVEICRRSSGMSWWSVREPAGYLRRSARRTAERGRRTLLLEKNRRAGIIVRPARAQSNPIDTTAASGHLRSRRFLWFSSDNRAAEDESAICETGPEWISFIGAAVPGCS